MENFSFGHDIVFRFGENDFSPKTSVQHDFLGWELLVGSIRFLELDRYLPDHTVSFLPVFSATPSWYAVVRNVLQKGQSQFATVIVDWPIAAKKFLPGIVESFPANVALVDTSFLSGEPSRTHSACYVIENLDHRRVVLAELGARCGQVVVSGSRESAMSHGTAEEHVPGELLLNSGVLPYLSAAFALADTSNETLLKPLGRALGANRESRAKKILVVASVDALAALALRLSELAKVTQDWDDLARRLNFDSLDEARKTRIETEDLTLVRVSAKSAVELCDNPGFVARAFCASRETISTSESVVRRSFAEAFSAASARYEEWTRLQVNRFQERNYFRFVYRLARESGRLFPSNFDILLAAQSSVDSNFAFEFLKECENFPSSEGKALALPEVEIPLEKIFPHVSHVSIRRFETLQKQGFARSRLKSLKHEKLKRSYTPVSEDKYANSDWVHEDHPYSCSFPDEDVFMEAFAFQCRAQVTETIKAKETTVSELQTSLGEGLDIRETIRNWHNQKLMIREELRTGKADVGTIVFDFAQLGDEERYSWQTYWSAESHDKSHLMFYATPFAECVIGPGIAKSEFGGFAVIPLESMAVNPWTDPYIRALSKRPVDALLLGGALVTQHRSILLISDVPPAQHVSDLLKRSGKSIIFVKLNEFSSEQIRKLRTFHILAEAGVREYAHKYIRKE